ncbi:hypothetical protein [Butyrivibrio sp. AD3002]|uniref:hypothetical protein n=1 Tax=Butyrivibrio sp. AD3002 TaxID=1280670 RepID=UPI0003B71D38|nr:hypothetical protein [Butyrivibrio sp. AD3002]
MKFRKFIALVVLLALFSQNTFNVCAYFTIENFIIGEENKDQTKLNVFRDYRINGSDSEELKYARHINVNALTDKGLDYVLSNKNLISIEIKDISNLDIDKVSKLYPYLCKGNIEYSAILLAYEHIKDSIGNDGTDTYIYAVDTYAPDSSNYYRSCATTVSAILNAAGYMDDYSSASVTGLVNYFENKPDDWECMGRLGESEMREGDVIFIDRRSHKSDYIKGILSDPDFDLEKLVNELENLDNGNAKQVLDETLDFGADGDGYYDEEGNYYEFGTEEFGYYDPDGNWCGYETPDGRFDHDGSFHEFNEEELRENEGTSKLATPKGGYNNVFNPDQNGDGTIDDTEDRAWSDYWLRLTDDVPDYSYYETWKKESDEYKEKLNETLDKLDESNLQKINGKEIRIHDHIILWLGNDVITQYYADSTGNIISGSYSDIYSRARSAAVSKFTFTGDYKIYRYKGF